MRHQLRQELVGAFDATAVKLFLSAYNNEQSAIKAKINFIHNSN